MSYALSLLCIALIIIFAMAIAGVINYRQNRKREISETIAQVTQEVESAFTVISAAFSYSRYITESERLSLENKYSGLYKTVSSIIDSKLLEESENKDLFKRFYKAMSDTKGHKEANNMHFVQNQLSNNAQYFDSVLTYPLDQQQREAIVSLEDNVLVISSAGSGKTMTTVGKVRYLIDKQQIAPEKILLITFTRKAAESLSERLGEKALKCRTFHKLALDIIGDATGEKPSITDKDFSLQVYHKLFDEDISFKQAITDYIMHARYKMKDPFEYDSEEEYLRDRQKYGIQAYFRDMDDHLVFCKSDEESKICDFLGSRGVKFRYEEVYPFATSDSNTRQYRPDFSIYIDNPDGSTRRIFLEHFAVNEQNHCPNYFSEEEKRSYLNSIQWKRNLHRFHGTTLIETSSAGFHRGDVFKVLSKQLQKEGVIFRKTTNRNVSRELARQEENILNTLTAFNFLMKSRHISIDSILSSSAGTPDRFMVNDIVLPFIETYKQMEAERNEIDFTDAIIRATELCNNGYRPDYDYILVDEFQDISLDRYHFLQSLRRSNPLTKLFCVGDDWQSIYRFAGSDMALFKHFEEYFGYTKKCLMETTYRFGEPAIDKSSRFILANPEQAVKHVRPFKSDSETVLEFLPTVDNDDVIRTVKKICDQIPADKEIMLLGRYSFDINVFKGTDISLHKTLNRDYVRYGDREMTFLTVHKSKGLECDYIILLNCNGGTMGFPADIADDPVLKYVLSEPDAYSFSEERRIFYVGITRAKKHTWVLFDINNPSPFLREFDNANIKSAKALELIPFDELCPLCHCGRITVVKEGKAINGNPYSVVVCSNRNRGCHYKETIFVNLNHYRRRINIG